MANRDPIRPPINIAESTSIGFTTSISETITAKSIPIDDTKLPAGAESSLDNIFSP